LAVCPELLLRHTAAAQSVSVLATLGAERTQVLTTLTAELPEILPIFTIAEGIGTTLPITALIVVPGMASTAAVVNVGTAARIVEVVIPARPIGGVPCAVIRISVVAAAIAEGDPAKATIAPVSNTGAEGKAGHSGKGE
jgi:hypothetical protein